jgi:hypothetical protein
VKFPNSITKKHLTNQLKRCIKLWNGRILFENLILLDYFDVILLNRKLLVRSFGFIRDGYREPDYLLYLRFREKSPIVENDRQRISCSRQSLYSPVQFEEQYRKIIPLVFEAADLLCL